MSLLRPVIRACAVAALRDQTWAEDRVYDSDMTPLGEAILGAAARVPYIVVYTDDDELDMVPATAQVYTGRARSLSLVLEIGVASAVEGVGENEIVLQFAATDEGMEWAVDITESQAIAALIGDPKSPWGELFKRFVLQVRKFTSVRGGQAEKGVRWAARKTVLHCRTLDDIVPGYAPPPNHPIRSFITMVKTYPHIGILDTSNLVAGLLEYGNAPPWREGQARLGNTTEAALALHLPGSPAPIPEIEIPSYDPMDSEWAPELTDVQLVDEGPIQTATMPKAKVRGGFAVASLISRLDARLPRAGVAGQLVVSSSLVKSASAPKASGSGALKVNAVVVHA